ncbi:MAG TPA: hypothetical protein VGJ66_00715, partial [Pyrinomonadaceae bacterium]|jgi:hypothetical protein
MNSWTQTDRQIGKWSAITVVILAAAYITTGAIWLVSNTVAARTVGLQPSEPYLSILETLLLMVNPALVVLFAAIHTYAPADKKTCSLAAFGFVLLLVVLTGFVHFIQLVVLRRTASETVAEVFKFYPTDGRLTAMFAADMLAWDFFFGFALLFAAPVFKGDRLKDVIRLGLIVCGLLCLAGVAFPVSGDARLQLPAILGYAFGFPFVCLLLAKLFARSAEPVS